nr:hypothetical protein [uncultured Flavobacterium sp.]
MKKLCITGLVLISLLTYSCSNDEERLEVQARDFKTIPQSVLKTNFPLKNIDSTAVKLDTDAIDVDGDPSNPIPPRPR